MRRKANRRQRNERKAKQGRMLVHAKARAGEALHQLRRIDTGTLPDVTMPGYRVPNLQAWRQVLERSTQVARMPCIPRKLRAKLLQRVAAASDYLDALEASLRLVGPRSLRGASMSARINDEEVEVSDFQIEAMVAGVRPVLRSADGTPIAQARVIGTPYHKEDLIGRLWKSGSLKRVP